MLAHQHHFAEHQAGPADTKTHALLLGLQVQFFVRGAQGQGQVSCDMWQDSSRAWQTNFLVVDVEGGMAHGRPTPGQRIMVVEPQMAIS